MDHQGEAEHQRVKRHYKQAEKRAFMHGIAKQNNQERIFHKMCEWKKEHNAIMAENTTQAPPTSSCPWPDSNDKEKLPYTSPEAHYHIPEMEKDCIDLIPWVHGQGDNIVYQVRSLANSCTLVTTIAQAGLHSKAEKSPVVTAPRARIWWWWDWVHSSWTKQCSHLVNLSTQNPLSQLYVIWYVAEPGLS